MSQHRHVPPCPPPPPRVPRPTPRGAAHPRRRRRRRRRRAGARRHHPPLCRLAAGSAVRGSVGRTSARAATPRPPNDGRARGRPRHRLCAGRLTMAAEARASPLLSPPTPSSNPAAASGGNTGGIDAQPRRPPPAPPRHCIRPTVQRCITPPPVPTGDTSIERQLTSAAAARRAAGHASGGPNGRRPTGSRGDLRGIQVVELTLPTGPPALHHHQPPPPPHRPACLLF